VVYISTLFPSSEKGKKDLSSTPVGYQNNIQEEEESCSITMIINK
jgi:hypothetical protein